MWTGCNWHRDPGWTWGVVWAALFLFDIGTLECSSENLVLLLLTISVLREGETATETQECRTFLFEVVKTQMSRGLLCMRWCKWLWRNWPRKNLNIPSFWISRPRSGSPCLGCLVLRSNWKYRCCTWVKPAKTAMAFVANHSSCF